VVTVHGWGVFTVTHSNTAAQAMKLIEQHYAEPLTATRIARMAGRSVLALRQEFRSAVGMSLRDYLTLVRMERARELLHASEKVEAVALQVGYRSKRQFIRQFKSHIGMLPSDFRRLDQ
jgi:AraC-like DNA-binding protein